MVSKIVEAPKVSFPFPLPPPLKNLISKLRTVGLGVES